jgi:hypothetical protein
MFGGLLLIAGAGAVVMTTEKSWIGVPTVVAILLGTALIVMSAFYARVHGVVRWIGLELWIDSPPPDRPIVPVAPAGGPCETRRKTSLSRLARRLRRRSARKRS